MWQIIRIKVNLRFNYYKNFHNKMKVNKQYKVYKQKYI